jgi:moderate conductance mechanosensitive channel
MAVIAETTTSSDVFSGHWFRTNGILIAIVIIVAIVISRLLRIAVRRYRARVQSRAQSPEDARRTTTVATTIATTIRIIVWTVVVLIVLGGLGIDIGPLLATAGIAGIVISFGAQSIVRDFLAGFFVLAEDQYAVGDVVELTLTGSTSLFGNVEEVTLRATSVRATDGTLAMTGNGNILAVRNLSRGGGVLRVEVRMPNVTDLSEARRRLDRAVAALRDDPSLASMLSGGPRAVDVVPTPDGGTVAIVAAETATARRADVEDALSRSLALRLLSPAQDPPANAHEGEGEGDAGGERTATD